MKKIALLFNTDRLGGAERSMVLQMSTFLSSQFENVCCHSFIPRIEGEKSYFDLENFLNHFYIPTFKFDYPKCLAKLSKNYLRSLDLTSLVNFPQEIISALKTANELTQYDLIYLNGNKVAYFFIPFLFLKKFKGKIIWHWRDYPVKSGAFSLFNIFYYLFVRNNNGLKLVANSYSVKTALVEKFYGAQVAVAYNPIGEFRSKKMKQPKKIGMASMLAPWKGIHQIILWWSLYQKELKEMGIEELLIYGEQIYKTNGGHTSYPDELKLLCKKLGAEGIVFKGNKNPEEIFQEIDILIHSSILPEPFGRVNVEAMKSGVLVVTTAMGGASEVCEDQVNSIHFRPYHYHELFQQISLLLKDKTKYVEMIENAKKFSQIHEIKSKEMFDEIICTTLDLKISLEQRPQVA